MGLVSSAKETKSSGRGMGFLFVFFPDHNNNDDSPSPSSPATSTSTSTTLFRSRSSRLLLSKAQSTISICILLLLLTLFLFTLSTFEPSSGFPAVSPRRFLLNREFTGPRRPPDRFALQGMGTLFLRGTRSMHDLLVAHVASDTTERDLRLFVRLLHRSGVTSRSDVVLLFDSRRFNVLIEEENNSFTKLVNLYRNSNRTDSVLGFGFNLSRFTKNQSKKETSEPLWGKKTHRDNNETELTHGSPNPQSQSASSSSSPSSSSLSPPSNLPPASPPSLPVDSSSTANSPDPAVPDRFALQGMGTLFLRGTRSMHDLLVAHVASDTTERDLRLFVRLLHRSGVTSRSDVVLLFDSRRFNVLIEEENNSFTKLVNLYRNSNRTDSVLGFGFNLSRFTKNQSKKETSEPLWGKKTHRDNNETELTHGSVVGFDVAELDPENSLSGFMDHVPLTLRRWACYPMLLGRVRRNFKHVMLVDAKSSLFLGDPFTRIRNRSPESVLFFSKHNSNNKINPAVIIGGAKGIRRLSSAMHTEIARATMQQQQQQHRRKSSVSESGVVSQLVGNVHMTKGFEVVGPSEVIAEASSLAELRTRNSASSLKSRDIIQRGNSNHFDITATIMKRICSSELDSSVYSYC
ncbi:hypothetical protein Bca52824_008317 [Brassica carinata]|uniref:DUF7780 domain-containing protein n=1 Tax=Brassica carinata TaxID=52824 RepID=A0A8X7W7V3_BRACI|nr:hypothetical protein Bca52824_008317 [Brassica carinata]